MNRNGYKNGTTNGHTNGHINGHQKIQSITHEEVSKSAAYLLQKTEYRPLIGIICGSGLGGLVDMLEDPQAFPYSEIPNFAVSTAPGHKGRLVFGHLGDRTVVCMQGRIHMYEGYPISKVVFPVRVMKMLGVRVLIATNAAGGLNPDFKVGDLMIMKDHITLPGMTGMNPLLGPNDTRFGPRFPALSKTYDKELQKVAKEAASDLGYDFIREGVYIVQAGPCYETIAECRYFRMIGADVTGMSTVPEATVANHMGMKVFAMSLVTNMCIMDYESEEIANEAEVLEVGKMRSKDMTELIASMVKRIDIKDV